MFDSAGKPIMEKGFYIFKNSWGTAVFGVTNPNGAGYGYISQRYIREFGTAYTTTVPVLGAPPAPTPTPPAPASCRFQCADYGFAANQCLPGEAGTSWSCDAGGECLTLVASCP